MSWNRSISTFHLLLVFLLAGDLASRIFVDANAIDCTYGFSPPDKTFDGLPKDKYLCWKFKGKGPDYSTYKCDQCGRADKHIPSARNCVDYDGKVMNGGGAWACESGIDFDTGSRPDGRNIMCNHIDNDGILNGYACKQRNVFQQCPEAHCYLVDN
ncbi:uncharacterized protein MELLADRAFT_124237 [Melampsora larici-populina 98AG31]|uniref:Secreted protein n=1 Tax=Melampsora larici-populina (strain 98AG31 / pathotype 3-4-7) TaxID=747676 RepID=F4RHS0_MELLP|nr:uncharacterized protein MELLADRAFT_124237 [Melampsora larici-populina 98AG31]EGG08085.1 secreted protein [Melampsora larici-populina 98AG31]